MEKIFLLVVGEKIEAFSSLRRLAKAIKVDPRELKKENLPFESGRFKILEIDLDTRI